MEYMKNLIFICFCLLGQAAYGTELSPLEIAVIEQAQMAEDFTEVLSIYENAHLKPIYNKKSTPQLEQEYEILQMALHLLSLATKGAITPEQLKSMQQTQIRSKKYEFPHRSFLGMSIFNITDIVENKRNFSTIKMKVKGKNTIDIRAATRQENIILSAKAKLTIARQILIFFEEEVTFLEPFFGNLSREMMEKHPLGKSILSACEENPVFFDEMEEMVQKYVSTKMDPSITEIRKEEQEKVYQKYHAMWDFYENFLFLPRLKVLSTLLTERQEASLSDFLSFLDKYESTIPKLSIPFPDEEMSVVENQAHVKVESRTSEEASSAACSIPESPTTAEIEVKEVDRTNSNDWIKADSDWVVAATKTGKATTLLATRVRKGKEERLSLTLKNPKGERVPDSLRSQIAPTCSRTYNREGEEWKRRDARHQFPSIVDSYILQYGIVERITERVLIQGRMVPKSYTFVRCFIVSMEWQIEGNPPIVLCNHEGTSFDTLEYIFSSELLDGQPIGDVYHRFLLPYQTAD